MTDAKQNMIGAMRTHKLAQTLCASQEDHVLGAELTGRRKLIMRMTWYEPMDEITSIQLIKTVSIRILVGDNGFQRQCQHHVNVKSTFTG